MKNFRKIKNIHTAPEVNMGPVKLRQAFPLNGLEQIDPFILLHHFDFTKGPHEHDFNVPPHPHRGFMPITYIFEGSVQHTDSLGNDKTIGKDEVQWINAARGIIHGEKVNKEFAAKGGRFQGIQLWINLPRSKKMETPSYQPLTKDEIVLIERNGAELRLVSGKYEDKKGPAHSDVFTAMLRMKKGSDFSFAFPASNNVTFYVLEGKVRINDTEMATDHHLIQFQNGEGEIVLEAMEESKLLLMAGDPINEPLVTHGPFVMNTQTEILEAMRDYQSGKMGFLY
jgi:quercetin 2,3-dioxygenase